ncbi:hypothetical protein IDH04_00155 [Pelagibacterales bacterium SAG-MED10]|nr:hypothetical protein [Pelagibacterales bacterium SAG-MED10]
MNIHVSKDMKTRVKISCLEIVFFLRKKMTISINKKNVFINLFKGKKKFINTEIKDIIIKPYISFSKVLILFVLKLILEYILPTKK